MYLGFHLLTKLSPILKIVIRPSRNPPPFYSRISSSRIPLRSKLHSHLQNANILLLPPPPPIPPPNGKRTPRLPPSRHATRPNSRKSLPNQNRSSKSSFLGTFLDLGGLRVGILCAGVSFSGFGWVDCVSDLVAYFVAHGVCCGRGGCVLGLQYEYLAQLCWG